MILDNQLVLSDAQAITADAGSTNVIDLGSVRQVGQGYPLAVCFVVTTAADATTGDETYSFNIQTDDNAAFSSATTVSTNAITAATLSLGSIHVVSLPTAGLERYIRAFYDVAGTTPTVTVTAFLQPWDMVQRAPLYYSNNSVIA